MYFDVDKDSLYKSINIADSIISSKNVNTILSNCLFQVSNNEIVIISTDNELGIRTRCDVISDSSFSFTANGKRFASILKELPKGEVSVSLSDSHIIDINSKAKGIKARYKLVGTGSEEFPEISFTPGDGLVEINQIVLKEMLRKVVHAAANDTIKPVFNGVFLISDANGTLSAVATDSRRLAHIRRSIEGDLNFNDGVILPLKTVNEVSRLLSAGGMCRFSIFENQCYFQINETEIVSRIVDSQFPNFKQVIPKEQHTSVVVDTQKIIESLRRAMVFTREPANKVIMNFKKDVIIIKAETPELGEAEEEIHSESNSKEQLSIGINAQFMLDAVKEIDSGSMIVGLTGQMSPVTVRPENDPEYTLVIMPIQIKST
jgi:DNA polymerase III subunit beta